VTVMTWDKQRCEACWVPATTQGTTQCGKPPEYLILRFLELYTNGVPVSPSHDIFNDALRWFCGDHTMDWMELEPDRELIPLGA
jgi:hypothetical protein